MRVQGAPLVTLFSNDGIVDLEFAWSDQRFRGLMLLWDDGVVLVNLWLDFLFIGAYTWLLSSCCWMQMPRYRKAGIPNGFAAAALAAGAFDILENVCLLARIGLWEQPLLLKGAAIAAGLKFSLIFLIVLFLLFSVTLRRKIVAAPGV